MNEQDIAKLRAAGFTDDDIRDYAANMTTQQAATGPVAPTDTLPEVDVTQKSETLKNAQAAGVPTTNEGSLMADAAALGAAAAPYALPGAGAALGLYGAAKVGGWGRELGKGVQAMAEAQRASAAAQQATAQGLQQRFNQRMAQQAAQGLRPVNPNAGAQVFNQMGQQLGSRAPMQPVAPQGMPTQAPAQPSSILQRGMDMASKVRQLAAQNIKGFGASGMAVPGAVGLGGAALSTAAANQIANMTPEQRRALYENEMLSAMSGDAGLAAAIMNAGQR